MQMNNQADSKKRFRCARIFFALLAGFLLLPAAQAQPPPQTVENRVLLIFDTSSAMKKCVPMTEVAVDQLFLSTLNGQLQPGDTVGVWTFAAGVSTGKLPLQVWNPANAAMTASNINQFVGQQHYADSTHFEPLMPMLDGLVQDSARLTVLIICDGGGQMEGTPYDAAINSIFNEKQGALQKAKQPFVIVLRSQLGRYIGCKISSPPSPLSFPDFPPLPPPPAPTNIPPPAPPVAVQLPPLIIVGTNVGTNLPPPAPNPAQTDSPPAQMKISVAPATSTVAMANSAARTNAVAPTENSGSGGKRPLLIGAVLFVAAGALTALVAFRARRTDQGSLITRSMNQKK
jgi:hypothetical protein